MKMMKAFSVSWPLALVAMGAFPGVACASVASDHPATGDNAESLLDILVAPVGIVTLSLITVAVCLGFFRRRNPKLFLKWHKRCGLSVLIAGAIHAGLVLITH